MSADIDQELYNLLLEKRNEGSALLSFCEKLIANKIDGATKLKRKIQTEIDNLEELLKNPCGLKAQHLTGNNLVHFNAVCNATTKYENVVSVLTPFKKHNNSVVIVDVVAENGALWVKAIARSAKGLHFSWSGETCSRERSIVDQGKDYVEAASCNLHHYRVPKIIFDFNAGVTEPISTNLKSLNIVPKGSIVEIDENELCSSDEGDDDDDDDDDTLTSSGDEDSEKSFTVNALVEPASANSRECTNLSINLDITAMFAYISNLTNGYANFRFKEPVLDEQAQFERTKPVLPGLKEIIDGNSLICCRTAYDSFLNILKTVGGEQEKKRGAELCDRITVVEDQMSEDVAKLQLGGKIKPRSKIIFGSGDYYKAVTLTANRSFVQAAASQGYKFAVIIHDSRALSEQKQQHAVPLNDTV